MTERSSSDPFTAVTTNGNSGVTTNGNPIKLMQLRLSFATRSTVKGQVLIQTTADVPGPGVTLHGAVAGVSIGDVARAFTLDAKGNAKPSPTGGKDTFKITTRMKRSVTVADDPKAKVAIKIILTSDDLAALATPADPNLPNNKVDAATNVETLNVPVMILIRITLPDGSNYDRAYYNLVALSYNAQAVHTAIAKTMRK